MSGRHGLLLPLLCLLALALSLSPTLVSGMIDRDQTVRCSSGDDFFGTWSFEFGAGGSYSLEVELLPGESVSARNHTVQVLLATDTELAPIRSATMADVCKSPDFNYSPVTWAVRLGAGRVSQASVQLTMPSRDWLRLLVLNCDADSFTLRYSSVAQNPGGEYLSLSQVPFKKMYEVFLWIWGACVAAWVAHLWLYRHWNIALQSLLVLLPLSKGVLCGPSELYWRQASSTGSYPRGLAWAVLLAQVADRLAWVVVIFLAASGWRLTKPALQAHERRALVVIASFLTTAYFAFEIWGSFLVFLLMLAYVLALRVVFAALLENGNAIIRQKHVLTAGDIDWTRTPLHVKLGMFKYLQVCLVAFISVDVLFHLWAAIFLKDRPWISDCAEHALSVMLCMALGWNFRMRPFNPFYLPIFTALIETNANVGEEGLPPVQPQLAAAEGNRSANRSGAGAGAGSGRVHSPGLSAGRGAAGGDEYHALASEVDDERSPDSLMLAAIRSRDQQGEAGRGDDGDGRGAGAGGSRLWGGAPTDQLWRPGCPVPPQECCVPAAFGADGAGGGAQLWLGAQHAAAAAPPPVEPVLVLEGDPSSDQPVMIGMPIRSRAGAHGGGGASALDIDGYSAAWSALPAAAVPYLPPGVRAYLDAQRRQLQHDQRRALPPRDFYPSVARRTAASDARDEQLQRARRHDSFPDYL